MRIFIYKKMKVVIGHKIINLEELFQISRGAEVVIDAQIYADLNKTAQDKGTLDIESEVCKINLTKH